MDTFRLFGLPLRHRTHLPPVDPATVTRMLVESAQLSVDALLTRLQSTTEGSRVTLTTPRLRFWNMVVVEIENCGRFE